MNLKRIIVILIVLLVSTEAQSAILYLKNGQALKGEVVEKSSYYVLFKSNNSTRKYLIGEVERVDESVSGIQYKIITDIDVSQFEGISEEKVLAIVKLIEVNGIRSSMEAGLMQTIRQSPPDRIDELKEVLSIDGIVASIVPIYDKHFSDDDLVSLIAFFSSVAGRRYIEKTPVLMQESMQASVKYFQEKLDK